MFTASFLENHDQPRFQSLPTDQSLVKNAMAWSFVTDGMAILYYQEPSYAASGGPTNREALWVSGYQRQNKPFLTHVTSLNQAQKATTNVASTFLTTSVGSFILPARPLPLPISELYSHCPF
jgi:alpha-amylase